VNVNCEQRIVLRIRSLARSGLCGLGRLEQRRLPRQLVARGYLLHEVPDLVADEVQRRPERLLRVAASGDLDVVATHTDCGCRLGE
jgi:hypothetical protein